MDKKKHGNEFIIEADSARGINLISWTLKSNGEKVLNYAYTLTGG